MIYFLKLMLIDLIKSKFRKQPDVEGSNLAEYAEAMQGVEVPQSEDTKDYGLLIGILFLVLVGFLIVLVFSCSGNKPVPNPPDDIQYVSKTLTWNPGPVDEEHGVSDWFVAMHGFSARAYLDSHFTTGTQKVFDSLRTDIPHFFAVYAGNDSGRSEDSDELVWRYEQQERFYPGDVSSLDGFVIESRPDDVRFDREVCWRLDPGRSGTIEISVEQFRKVKLKLLDDSDGTEMLIIGNGETIQVSLNDDDDGVKEIDVDFAETLKGNLFVEAMTPHGTHLRINWIEVE